MKGPQDSDHARTHLGIGLSGRRRDTFDSGSYLSLAGSGREYLGPLLAARRRPQRRANLARPVKPVSLQAGEKTGFSQPQEAAYSSPFLSQLGQEADPQGFIASGPSGKTRRLRSVSSEECRRRQWELAVGPALKLEIQQKGWYRVRQPELLEAGLSPGVNPRFLQLIVGGEEEPLLVLGEEDDRFDAWDAVEFYGTGADTPLTGTRIYWLVEGEEPGKRVVGEGWSGIGSSRGASELLLHHRAKKARHLCAGFEKRAAGKAFRSHDRQSTR